MFHFLTLEQDWTDAQHQEVFQWRRANLVRLLAEETRCFGVSKIVELRRASLRDVRRFFLPCSYPGGFHAGAGCASLQMGTGAAVCPAPLDPFRPASLERSSKCGRSPQHRSLTVVVTGQLGALEAQGDVTFLRFCWKIMPVAQVDPGESGEAVREAICVGNV